MMNKLKAKLKNQGGFTLVEMLIVVAIIAILIMVSVPMILANLEKAREATDDANLRSAQGVAYAYYLTETSDPDSTVTFADTGSDFAYKVDNNHRGEIMVGTATAGNPGYDYGLSSDNKDGYVKVTINAKGVVTATWDTP